MPVPYINRSLKEGYFFAEIMEKIKKAFGLKFISSLIIFIFSFESMVYCVPDIIHTKTSLRAPVGNNDRIRAIYGRVAKQANEVHSNSSLLGSIKRYGVAISLTVLLLVQVGDSPRLLREEGNPITNVETVSSQDRYFIIDSLAKSYNSLNTNPIFIERDGRASLYSKSFSDSRNIILITGAHGSQIALDLNFRFLEEKMKNEKFNPNEWLFLIEGWSNQYFRFVEITFLTKVAQNFGIMFEDPIENPYGKKVLEEAGKQLNIDIDEVYFHSIARFIAAGGENQERVLQYFAEKKSITYESMVNIWENQYKKKLLQYATSLEKFREENSKVNQAIIGISNKRSERLLRDAIKKGQKNILIYIGEYHAPIVYNLFGKDGWKEFENKDYQKLQRVLSLEKGMRINLYYHEPLYPSFQAQKPFKIINARVSSLEIIKVERVSKDEVWIEVRVLTSSQFRYYDLDPAQKEDTGWIKVTSDPNTSFYFSEEHKKSIRSLSDSNKSRGQI